MAEQSAPDHLTTTQVAALCGVCRHTVGHWCDKNWLRHFRIPGSGLRRIRRDWLATFLRDHEMPLFTHADRSALALLVALCADALPLAQRLAERGWQVERAEGAFGAGRLCSNGLKIAAAVVDLNDLGQVDGFALANQLARSVDGPVIVLATDDTPLVAHQVGGLAVMNRPLNLDALVTILDRQPVGQTP